MNAHDTVQEPNEHARFAAYLDQLQQIAEADEIDLISHVLSDPDQTMAQSAVVRHLDRRAADLHLDPAYVEWSKAMAQAAIGHPFLTRRLHEWSLLRAITLNLSWRPGDLLTASDWLQLKAAAESSTAAVEILAEGGRTKRIRNSATVSLKRQSQR
ncbi:hypothetical protein [Amycolatopsis sp. DSM 110486]|uniref:hypothetical protein n=1 Tax=Amycolatopsis sp. DSM 110486 TaxID=2865832 RepID=UPI001C6A8669|nr:hypothetical protein [Amycolatopsis sp. DSM 110486]QYN18899.1 hypothetical protein K1T34_40365 [Amycolatopsis sp. DSM 110486]